MKTSFQFYGLWVLFLSFAFAPLFADDKIRDQQDLIEVSETIFKEKEKTPRKVAEELNEFFTKKIAELEKPLGHGTRGNFLESILENGLGNPRFKPANSTSKSSHLTDLKKEDGILAAYPFALRDYTAKDLSVDSFKVTKRDIVDRFMEANKEIRAMDVQSKKTIRATLTEVAEGYLKKRAPRESYPVLLVYEGKGLKKMRVNAIISEVITDEVLNREWLKMMLVPAKEVSTVVKEFQKNYPNQKILVFPLELVELNEIYPEAK